MRGTFQVPIARDSRSAAWNSGWLLDRIRSTSIALSWIATPISVSSSSPNAFFNSRTTPESLRLSTTKSKSAVARGSVSNPIACAPTSAQRAWHASNTSTTRAISLSAIVLAPRLRPPRSLRPNSARCVARICIERRIASGTPVGDISSSISSAAPLRPCRPAIRRGSRERRRRSRNDASKPCGTAGAGSAPAARGAPAHTDRLAAVVFAWRTPAGALPAACRQAARELRSDRSGRVTPGG